MLEATLALLAGLLVGSFLNVCVYRMPRDLSVIRPRSYCPACEAPIASADNIPVLSYLVLKGRCRRCGARISPRYLAVELATGLLFFLIVASLGAGLPALKLCLLSALLVGLVFTDLEQKILPDEFTLGGTAAGILLAALVPMSWGYGHVVLPSGWSPRWLSVGESLIGAGVASGSLWLVGALYHRIRGREGLGFGDVKMMAMVGSFLGLHGALQTLILGSILGSIYGLVYIKITGKDAATFELPFGSFLGGCGILVALLAGGVFG